MYYLTIIILLGIITWLWMRPARVEIIDKQEWQKREAVKHLRKTGEITNTQYRKLVGVSQSQATRDLDELEKSGVVVQVGKTGKYVKYRLKG